MILLFILVRMLTRHLWFLILVTGMIRNISVSDLELSRAVALCNYVSVRYVSSIPKDSEGICTCTSKCYCGVNDMVRDSLE